MREPARRSARDARYASEARSIQCTSSTTITSGWRALADTLMRTSASRVRALTASGLSPASRSPAGPPSRCRRNGAHSSASRSRAPSVRLTLSATRSSASVSAIPQAARTRSRMGKNGDSDAVGHALAREIRHLAGRQALAKLIEQPRLADAGLADDPHETALPAHGELQMLGQELQLRGASDEAGHASAGSKPRALEARDAIRARGGQGRRGHRNQREAPAQERGRLLADGDGAGRRREPLERIERGLLVRDVDEGHLTHLPRGDGGHVDGAPHRGGPVIGAALLGHPLRRQARQRGPDRAILDRLLDAECRDDRRLPQLFDATAEAPDLVEQLVDRPRALGQAVRARGNGQVDAEEADLARLRAHAHPHGGHGQRPGVGGGRCGGGNRRRRGPASARAPGRRHRAGRRRGRARARRSAEPEARHPRTHRIARDAQRHRGPRDIPVGPDERGVEVLAHLLVPGQRIGRLRGGRRARPARDGQAERGGGDDRRIVQQDHPLEDIAQLPDIAGPGVAGERVARVGGERPLGEPVVRAGPCQEVLGEDQHVEAALAERRQGQRDDGEPVVEILAKALGRDRGAEILVGGGHDPHVGGLGAGAAEAPHGALLERGEELGLKGRGEQADLVEKEHAAMGELKQAGLGLARVGEGPLLVAEQLGLEQALRDGGAVDVDERLGRARPGSMQRPREQALARSGLAEDQQRRRTHRHRGGANELLNLSPQGDHGGAIPDQVCEGIHDPPILPHRAGQRCHGRRGAQRSPGGTRPSCISAHCASVNGGSSSAPSCWRERKRFRM